jgi:transposase
VIAIPRPVRVFFVTEPVDFRKSIDGLCGVVESHLERDALTGHVFVFHNKS